MPPASSLVKTLIESFNSPAVLLDDFSDVGDFGKLCFQVVDGSEN